ncbi:MAG: hypothetical protein AABZ58_14155 [Chloroflexota bacterium]
MIAAGIAGGVLMGVVVGAITGAVLVWLLRIGASSGSNFRQRIERI